MNDLLETANELRAEAYAMLAEADRIDGTLLGYIVVWHREETELLQPLRDTDFNMWLSLAWRLNDQCIEWGKLLRYDRSEVMKAVKG